MRVLAFDHGAARCGCAVSDPSGVIARPLDPLEPPDPAAAARLIADQGAEAVVVGLPVSLDGSEGEQARAAREFADRLAAITDRRVELFDERLTTRMAAASRRGGARAAEDSLAAAHLLEGFLRTRERSGTGRGPR